MSRLHSSKKPMWKRRSTKDVSGNGLYRYILHLILQIKRGAIILIHRLLPFTATNSYKETDGRIVLVKGELYGESVLLGNVYAPNVYDKDFFALQLNEIAEMDCTNMIIGGDFNCYLSPSLDRDPPHKDQSKSLQHFLEIFNLLDGWRYMNFNNNNYTFNSPPHLTIYLYLIT